HALHRELYAVDDPASGIEMVTWRMRVRCGLRNGHDIHLSLPQSDAAPSAYRDVYVRGRGRLRAAVHRLADLPAGAAISGPAIVESDFTTVMIAPDATATRLPSGSLLIEP